MILKFLTVPRVAFVTDTDMGLLKIISVQGFVKGYLPTKHIANSLSPGVPRLSVPKYSTDVVSVNDKVVTRDMPVNDLKIRV